MKEEERKISQSQAERALFHTLKDEGLLPPESEEDIAALEEEVGMYPQSSFNLDDAIQLIRQEVSEPETREGAVTKYIGYSLAAAARRGGKIPPEILERMERDRKKAEDEQGSP